MSPEKTKTLLPKYSEMVFSNIFGSCNCVSKNAENSMEQKLKKVVFCSFSVSLAFDYVSEKLVLQILGLSIFKTFYSRPSKILTLAFYKNPNFGKFLGILGWLIVAFFGVEPFQLYIGYLIANYP